jgi:hypothetical protein
MLEGTAEHLAVYREVRGQIITLGEQVVDINHLALRAAIDRHKVKEPDLCFNIACRTFHHFLAKSREDAGG